MSRRCMGDPAGVEITWPVPSCDPRESPGPPPASALARSSSVLLGGTRLPGLRGEVRRRSDKAERARRPVPAQGEWGLQTARWEQQGTRWPFGAPGRAGGQARGAAALGSGWRGLKQRDPFPHEPVVLLPARARGDSGHPRPGNRPRGVHGSARRWERPTRPSVDVRRGGANPARIAAWRRPGGTARSPSGRSRGRGAEQTRPAKGWAGEARAAAPGGVSRLRRRSALKRARRRFPCPWLQRRPPGPTLGTGESRSE